MFENGTQTVETKTPIQKKTKTVHKTLSPISDLWKSFREALEHLATHLNQTFSDVCASTTIQNIELFSLQKIFLLFHFALL